MLILELGDFTTAEAETGARVQKSAHEASNLLSTSVTLGEKQNPVPQAAAIPNHTHCGKKPLPRMAADAPAARNCPHVVVYHALL